jgi:hypothetical protein
LQQKAAPARESRAPLGIIPARRALHEELEKTPAVMGLGLPRAFNGVLSSTI